MFFLFCYRHDREAIWFYEQLISIGKIKTAILFAEDLYECKDWLLRVNNNTDYAGVTLPDGTKVHTENVSLFLNRVHFLNHTWWGKKDMVEQQYLQQEWNAFLLGWLKAFEPVLVNKPVPSSLTGYMPSPPGWALMAKKAGFLIRPQTFSSADFDATQQQTVENTGQTRSVLVFNNKVFGPADLAGLSEAGVNLAKKAGCHLLEIFILKDKNGKNYFLAANSLTSLSTHSGSFTNAFMLLAINRQQDCKAVMQETNQQLSGCYTLKRTKNSKPGHIK